MDLSFIQSDGGRALAGFPAMLTGDCVARAIAHATAQPYGPVWYKLAFMPDPFAAQAANRLYLSADNGISPDACEGWLKELGFVRLTLSGCAHDRFMASMPFLASGAYLLNTPRHMTACINGCVWDTWDTRACYVERAWALTR
jgi:hypothetical protein